MNRASAQLARAAAERLLNSGSTTIRRRSTRTDESHRQPVARRQRSRPPQHHVRCVWSNAYIEAIRGLMAGGVDLIMIETVFDTLNAKAAIFAIESEFAATGAAHSGHDFGHDHRCERTDALRSDTGSVLGIDRARPTADRGTQLRIGSRATCGRTSNRSPRPQAATSASTPTPGLPNEFGGYDQSASHMAGLIGEFAAAGLVNLVGGCCGTTPDHIAAIAAAVAGVRPTGAAQAGSQAAPGRPRTARNRRRRRCSSTSASEPTSPVQRASKN